MKVKELSLQFEKITDNLYKFDNLLTETLFFSCLDEFNPEYNNWMMKIEKNVKWIGVFKGGGTNQNIGDNLSFLEISSYLKLISESILKKKLSLMRVSTNIQFFGQETVFHVDGDQNKWTFLIFVNRIWNAEWGGHFIINTNDTRYHSFIPIPNNGILFRADQQHKGDAPNKYCDISRETLAFTFIEEY